MLGKDDLARLLAYTEWANHRLVRMAAQLEKEQYARDLHSSHGGVRGTLVHMLGAEWVWLERWKGNSPTKFLNEDDFEDVMVLRGHWRTLEEHRRSWFEALKPEDAGRVIAYRNMKGEPFENPLWQLVQHVANHSTYHRGQVVTMLRMLGARAVGTDMVAWDRDQSDDSSPVLPPLH